MAGGRLHHFPRAGVRTRNYHTWVGKSDATVHDLKGAGREDLPGKKELGGKALPLFCSGVIAAPGFDG